MLSLDPFRSKAERFFWSMCPIFPQIVPELKGFDVVKFQYEAITFHLPGNVKYCPDFYLRLEKENYFLICIVEVKGTKKAKGYATTRTKLSQCAGIYPEYVFFEVLATSNQITGIELLTKPPFAISTCYN